ncbi:hypothetical protein CYB_1614 [Synechococcus sp. JA-2-3B'a(2-13)]|nr:hypothetical protein CYB_1614 [Synechococcus sp. JA-2-3B'a(2-13)]
MLNSVDWDPSGAVSSAVERLPYKQDVTGSSPVPPIPIQAGSLGDTPASQGRIPEVE